MNFTTHGETVGGRWSPEYTSYRNMLQRCSDPNSTEFKRYGAKGIGVCRRWMRFENFLADMGRKPSARHSLDRINGKRNYSPSNCRWATPAMQARNRSTSKLTWAKVLEIRRQIVDGDGNTTIGKRFGVSNVMISRIRLGRSWVEKETQ